jgi:glutamate-ammonia-ligase adenylyltransferase
MSSAAEHPRGGSPAGRLARLGFADAARAERLLGASGLNLGYGEAEVAGSPADAVLVEALAAAADPDLALLSLCRLIEAASVSAAAGSSSGNLAGLVHRLLAEPLHRDRLIAVLGASSALGEHLIRHPDDVALIADERSMAARPSADELRRLLQAAVGADPDAPPPMGTSGARAAGAGPETLLALRSAYRRVLLALAARDLTGTLAIDDVAAELADLAGAALGAALAIAVAGLAPDAEPCRLAVIGMGKCGGRELNYVSDVDVVFVAEPMPGGDEGRALATATALAAGLMRACSATTGEGALWPVDAGLRPEGKSGPLVRTLASHTAYYQRWAKTWEFQALLKARPVAGDVALGAAYCAAVAPLVWTAGDRPNFVADVQAMRRRVENSLPAAEADRELKLGPGGLRDVEFAVQLLQLVHGRADEALRSPSTLPALDALAAGGYVGREDARRLADSYRYLRKVEHRLQLQRLRRTHRVPTKAAPLRWLARSLGYRATRYGDAVASFEYERVRYARVVRGLHEKLFYRPLLSTVAQLPAGEARLSPGAARQRLEALGFADPAGALRHLEALTSGVSRRAAIQRTLLPAMLASFAAAADPDAGLLAYRQVSDALGATPWYLRLLRDEGAVADRLARLLAGSRYVADLLVRAPAAVAMLGATAELAPRPVEQLTAEVLAVVGRHDDWEQAVAIARGLRRHELLRIACADLLGMLDPRAVGSALTAIATATIAGALDTAQRKVATELRGELPVRMAIIAMGRLGGGEQGYGSDADVLFVYDAPAGIADAAAASAAQAVAEELRRLLALPAPDPPLTVDADLRPEGRQGPLTRSLASYAAYYARWASVWESQALLRATPIAGDPDLGRRFVELIDPVRYPGPGLPAAAVVEIRRIKARVEAERLPRGADPATHTKLGRGGIADVEWTVQLLQLQHAGRLPALRTTSTLEALAAAAAAGLLSAADKAVLEQAWRAASGARNAMMLARGRATDSLPSTGRDLAGVARVLGYPAERQGEFLEDYLRATRRARAVVERIFYG